MAWSDMLTLVCIGFYRCLPLKGGTKQLHHIPWADGWKQVLLIADLQADPGQTVWASRLLNQYKQTMSITRMDSLLQMLGTIRKQHVDPSCPPRRTFHVDADTKLFHMIFFCKYRFIMNGAPSWNSYDQKNRICFFSVKNEETRQLSCLKTFWLTPPNNHEKQPLGGGIWERHWQGIERFLRTAPEIWMKEPSWWWWLITSYFHGFKFL